MVYSAASAGASPFSEASSMPVSQPAATMVRITRESHSCGLGRAVAHSQHGECGADSHDAHAVAARRAQVLGLGLERECRDLDDVVQHAREGAHEPVESAPVRVGLRCPWIVDHPGQIDRSEQTRAVRRKRLLSARVGGPDLLAEPRVVHRIHPVDEDDAGLSPLPIRPHDPIPQGAGLDGAEHLACDPPIFPDLPVRIGLSEVSPHPLLRRLAVVGWGRSRRECERPVGIRLQCRHERVRDQERDVEVPEHPGGPLGLDQRLDVRVSDVEGRHLGTAACSGALDDATRLIVDLHEPDRSRCPCARASHVPPLGAQGGEFISDPASRLQRHGPFVQAGHDPLHAVMDGSADGAVDRARPGSGVARACVGHDPSAGDRPGVHGFLERLAPFGPLFLSLGQRFGDSCERLLSGLLHRFAFIRAQCVFFSEYPVRSGLPS